MAPVNEFDLIEKYFRNVSPQVQGTELGNGDDCALLKLGANEVLAVSVDTCVEGVHFPEGAAPKDIAQRALRTALSDLAACAAEPRWVTLALSLPEVDEAWLQGFSHGLKQDLAEFQCELVGGDTTKGPLTVTVQVMGVARAGVNLNRGGAKVGDAVFVTNTVGNGAASLLTVLNRVEVDSDLKKALDHAFYRPPLAFAESKRIAGLANSAVDISDGLVADLGHICTASGVSANIYVTALPYSNAAKQLAAQIVSGEQRGDLCVSGLLGMADEDVTSQALLSHWALYGGDDYQVCFTAPIAAVQAQIASGELNAVCIGEVVNSGAGTQNQVFLKQGENGSPSSMHHSKSGYTHFG